MTSFNPRENPHIVLVTGIWHSPVHWARQIHALEFAGFATTCPRLCAYNAPTPNIGVREDVAEIQHNLQKIIGDDELDVILVSES